MLQNFSAMHLSSIAQGSNHSDSGSYSTVYEGVSPTTVIKIGHSINDGWLIWALYCMTHKGEDPNLPNIHSLHIDFRVDMKFISLMERLEPEDYFDNSFRSVQGVVRDCAFAMLPDSLVDICEFHISRCTEQFEIPGVEFFVDLHDENVMTRTSDDCPVITDPLSSVVTREGEGLIYKSRNGLDIHDFMLELYMDGRLPEGLTCVWNT